MSIQNCKIYVTRLIPQPGLDILNSHFTSVPINPKDQIIDREKLLKEVRGLDGLLCLLTDKIDAELMDAAGGQIKIISNYAVGFDNIDISAANKRGIMITNTPGVLTDATADMAWALLFALARRIPESDQFTRALKYHGWGPMMFLGGDITGKTLGIIGAGRIGTAMALKSRGFQMTVLYCDENHNQLLEHELSAQKVEFEQLLKLSDYISIHVPLLKSTHHLIDAKALQFMKKSAYLINTARGPIVDEAALVKALKDGIIAGAGLDVYEQEPKIHPGLINLENVVLTPHTASATIETRSKMATMAATNLVEGLCGRRPPNLLNPEVL
jgi:lactate dehydrogenase-like 2-hydroxyacid dehydrogenase